MRRSAPVSGVVAIVLVAAVAAGCGQGSPSAPVQAASASAQPSPTATASLAPEPSATADRVLAFFEQIRDPDASYRLDEMYELTLGAEHQTTISHADVAAGDSLYVSDSVAGDVKRHEETATVDGTVYQRTDTGPWTNLGPQGDPGTAFAFLATDRLVHDGRGLAGGVVLDRLSLVAPVPINSSFTEALGVTGGQTLITRFDAFTEPDGRPAVIEYDFAVADSTGSTVGVGSYRDTFTDFGADDIVVEAPTVE